MFSLLKIAGAACRLYGHVDNLELYLSQIIADPLIFLAGSFDRMGSKLRLPSIDQWLAFLLWFCVRDPFLPFPHILLFPYVCPYRARHEQRRSRAEYIQHFYYFYAPYHTGLTSVDSPQASSHLASCDLALLIIVHVHFNESWKYTASIYVRSNVQNSDPARQRAYA